MRLLNAHDLTLAYFNDERHVPDYAILSHTWSNDEVSLKDITELSPDQLIKKRGYEKVKTSCSKALEWGLKWIWIDTLCIDQNSSAELSEAINSMYDWYRDSAVCYAYLADVSTVEDDFFPDRVTNSQSRASFNQARWFTRGWTLQELIAPRNMQFYNKDWAWIGSKDSLRTHISRLTDIDEYGMFIPDLSVLSVAHRMSWAARRQTTRPEDIAYCLLGIFNINMPLLYGEGRIRAFGRLQEEIMRRTEDHSIFAWSGRETDFRNDMVGFLAPHPAAFTYGNVDLCELPNDADPLSITGRGIRAQVPLVRRRWNGQTCLAIIGCSGPEVSKKSYYGIPVMRLKKSSDVYRRSAPDLQSVAIEEAEAATLSTIYLLRHSRPTHLEDKDTTQVWFSLLEMRDCIFKIERAEPRSCWGAGRRVFAFSPSDFRGRPQMTVMFTNAGGDGFLLRIDLNLSEGISARLVGFDAAHAEETWDTNFSMPLLGEKTHEFQSELTLGRRTVSASVKREAVFEQILYEVKLSIGF